MAVLAGQVQCSVSGSRGKVGIGAPINQSGDGTRTAGVGRQVQRSVAWGGYTITRSHCHMITLPHTHTHTHSHTTTPSHRHTHTQSHYHTLTPSPLLSAMS